MLNEPAGQVNSSPELIRRRRSSREFHGGCLSGRGCQLAESLDIPRGICRGIEKKAISFYGGGFGRLNARAASSQVLLSRLAYSHIAGIITQGSGVLRG